jgi:hypothetical protein
MGIGHGGRPAHLALRLIVDKTPEGEVADALGYERYARGSECRLAIGTATAPARRGSFGQSRKALRVGVPAPRRTASANQTYGLST